MRTFPNHCHPVKEGRRWGRSREHGLDLSKWVPGVGPMKKVAWESLVCLSGSECADLRREIRDALTTSLKPSVLQVDCHCCTALCSLTRSKETGRASQVASIAKGGWRFMCRIKGQRSRVCDSARQRPLHTWAVCISQERTIWPRWQVASK